MRRKAKAKSVCIIAEVENGYGVKSHEFAREIVRQGHQVELVSCRFNVFSDARYKQPHKDIKLIYTPMSVFNRKNTLYNWNHFLKDIKSDVVILQRSSMFFGTHGFLMACRRHFRKVFFIQRFPDGPMPEPKKVSYLGGLFKAAELWWYRERINRPLKAMYADRIIAISNFMKDHLVKEWGYPIRKIECVMNGINWRSFARNPAHGLEFRGEHGIAPDALVFGILARLYPEKGVDVALEALALLKERFPARKIHLAVVGDGPECGSLMEQVRRLKLQDMVTFCGYMSDPRPALSGMDVLLAPTRSKMEAFGLSVAEGMAAGCLPIVSSEGGMAEIVNSTDCGWRVRAGDPKELFLAMQEVLEASEDKKQAIRNNGLNRIKQHFDAEVNYKRILSIFGIM